MDRKEIINKKEFLPSTDFKTAVGAGYVSISKVIITVPRKEAVTPLARLEGTSWFDDSRCGEATPKRPRTPHTCKGSAPEYRCCPESETACQLLIHLTAESAQRGRATGCEVSPPARMAVSMLEWLKDGFQKNQVSRSLKFPFNNFINQ